MGLDLPATLTRIGDRAFARCGAMRNIQLPAGLEYLGEGAFSQCASLEEITIPAGIRNLDLELFGGCRSLSNVTILGAVTNVGYHAFSYCTDLESIVLPDSVVSLGDLSFADCRGLAAIDLPASLTQLGLETFYNCAALTSITIPSGVTNIGNLAFKYCENLRHVYFAGDAPDFTSEFGYLDDRFPDNLTFQYSNQVTIYRLPNATGWGEVGSSYGTRPTALWTPPTLSSQPGQPGAIVFAGPTGLSVRVEACTDLQLGNWTPLATLILDGTPLPFLDPQSSQYPARYYRTSVK